MKRIGILNISSYTGIELTRIICSHPEVELASATGRTAAGQKLAELFPHVVNCDLSIESELSDDVDLIFSALPHAASAQALAPYVEQDIPVIDLSADFRINDPKEYELWYGNKHPNSNLLNQSVYGLSELNRELLKGATLVANPGCYPTGALLALAPAIKAGIVGPNIIIDSKSGVSGAGRTPSLTTHFSEVDESVHAYGIASHRHLPEIIQELAGLFLVEGESSLFEEMRVTFTPHLNRSSQISLVKPTPVLSAFSALTIVKSILFT